MAEQDNNAGGGEGAGGGGPSAEIIARASEMGWVPQDKFRGDPAKWVDADTFIEKGEQVLPLIKANNRRLTERLQESENRNSKLSKDLEALRDSVRAMQELQHREAKGRVERRIRSLREQIEEARAEKETQKVVELQEQLDELTNERTELDQNKPDDKEGNETDTQEASAAAQRVTREIEEWQSENSWYNQNKIKTRIANAISTEMRSDPKFKGVVGKPFLEELTRRTNEEYAEAFGDEGGLPDKTSGGSLNGSRAGGGGNTRRGKGYHDLPADAKAQCDKDATRFVGENKAFTTKEAYQTYYAAEYFGEEV